MAVPPIGERVRSALKRAAEGPESPNKMAAANDDFSNFVNLTPHEVTLQRKDGTRISLPSTASLRLDEVEEPPAAEIDGVPVYGKPVYKGLVGYELKSGNYIVSMLVADYVKAHQSEYEGVNIYVPHTGPTMSIREKGQIVAVKALVHQ